MERLLSPRLSWGTPPGSGMVCVPSSYPGQVFSCCKWAAVGLLCPFPILSKEQLRARPRCRSAPAHRPPAAAPGSLPATQHPQDSAQQREGEPRAEPAGERRSSSPFISLLCQPHTSLRCASTHHLPIRLIQSLSSLKDLNTNFPGRSP